MTINSVKKLDYWTVRTCQSSYYVRNMNKRECIAWLIERGMCEAAAKVEVKKW
jgi:hypothetical protein